MDLEGFFVILKARKYILDRENLFAKVQSNVS